MDFFTLELERDALRSYKRKKANGFKDDDDEIFPDFFMGGEKERKISKNSSSNNFFTSFINKRTGFDRQKKKFHKMSQSEIKERTDYLWDVVRRYTKELMLKARIKKLEEQTMKDITFDMDEDVQEEKEKEEDEEYQPRWYLIEKDGKPCQFWDFMITCIIIYNLFVTPFILVFPDVYQDKDQDGNYVTRNSSQQRMKSIEMVFDIIYCIEIILNFVKRTRGHKTLPSIAWNYISNYFFFDVISVIPLFNTNDIENFSLYYLKAFKIARFDRIAIPHRLLLSIVLQKLSKQRQNDLNTFCGLILNIVYISHVSACFWIFLGFLDPCTGKTVEDDGCIESWIYENGFSDKTYESIYIFSFYWIFEVITTVGYGDYTGKTLVEYVFSVALEFLGLVFFSFLMGSITSIFGASDNFDDLIEYKLDTLDMWIKKIEKSNKPYHIQPTLYSDIRKYVEQAFLYDFNLVIEEFPFYHQITPKMQSDLIQNTKVFQEFERSFNHFFDDCERGFINEFIINMFCRIF